MLATIKSQKQRARRAHARTGAALAASLFIGALVFCGGAAHAHASVIFGVSDTEPVWNNYTSGRGPYTGSTYYPATAGTAESVVLYLGLYNGIGGGSAWLDTDTLGIKVTNSSNTDIGCESETHSLAYWGVSADFPPDSDRVVFPLSGTCTLTAGQHYNFKSTASSTITNSALVVAGDENHPSNAWIQYRNDNGLIDPTPEKGTGVIKINSPQFAATTTSPVAISFDYTLVDSGNSSENNLLYNQYRLVFTNQDTQQTITKFGSLAHDTYGVWTQTDSVSLTGDGTWLLNVALATEADSGTRSYAARGWNVYFGLEYLEASDIPPQFLPPSQSSYASSTCAISFAGTFDLPQCLGYLIVPTTGSTSPIRNIQALSLAHAFPFAYVYQLGDIRQALFGASSTASTSIGIALPWIGGPVAFTFISESMISAVPYSGTIKTLITALLWLMLAELVYYRVIRAHDTNTPTT